MTDDRPPERPRPTPADRDAVMARIVNATTGWKPDEVTEWGRRMLDLPMATPGTLDEAATILTDSWTSPGHPGFGMFVQAHKIAVRNSLEAPHAPVPRPQQGVVRDPARRAILSYAAYVLMRSPHWRASQGQPAEHRHADSVTARVWLGDGSSDALSVRNCPRCGDAEMDRLWTCAVLDAEARYAAGTLGAPIEPPDDLVQTLPAPPVEPTRAEREAAHNDTFDRLAALAALHADRPER